MKTKQDRGAKLNKPPFRWRSPRKKPLKEIFTSRDFWFGVYVFAMFQISIILLTISALSESNKGLFLIVSMVMAIGVSIHGLIEAKRRQRVTFRYTPASPLRVIAYVGFIYAGVFAISTLFVVMKWEIPVQENQESLNQLLQQYIIPMTLITGVVAPITEELAFRELFPYAFGPSYISFIIFSIIFALLHSPSGLIGYAIYGFLAIAFMFIRLKDNNILTAIYVHMGYNLLTVVLSML